MMLVLIKNHHEPMNYDDKIIFSSLFGSMDKKQVFLFWIELETAEY